VRISFLIDGTYSSGIITGTLTVDGTTKTVTNVDLTTARTYDYHFHIIAQQFPNSGFWIVSTKDYTERRLSGCPG